MSWTLGEQHQIPCKGQRPLRADGVFLDQFKLRHGVWEAKDSQDNLDKEVKKKFREGYSVLITNNSFHWDMICDMHEDSKIRVDRDLFYKNGEFQI